MNVPSARLGYIGGREGDTVRDTTALRALPPEQPLDMPRHKLHERRRKNVAGWRNPLDVIVSRILLALATVALTAFGVHEMYEVMSTQGVTTMQWLFFALFAINFGWISFAGCQAVLGFAWMMLPSRKPATRPGPPTIRTAVLYPVYNEAPERVAAAIEVLASGLAAKAPGRFAVFILSDTNRPDCWIAEEQAYAALVQASDRGCPVYYRHRRRNAESKAGNIADWVSRFGGGYEAMAVLDADSIMSAETLIEMARRMAADDGLGLLQTAPVICRATSLFGRLQQFASRCYGPVVARGLSAWHGRDGNFWGHNAIIRTAAFAEAARLPVLRGRAPFGGHVMSHDFIEAALLRRAGYGVRLDTDLGGSFEEAPPALQDVVARDRRWCQGNLQHVSFLTARGLTGPTRLHLASGIMAYLSSPFWLMLVLIGLMLAGQVTVSQPGYFSERSLFPIWPVFDAERAIELFVLSMGIVLAPKFLGVIAAMLRPSLRRGFGGGIRLVLSALAEIVLSVLYAPVMMIAQSRIVGEILTGRDSGWKAQRRNDGGVPLLTALRAHRWQMVTGVALALLSWELAPDLFFWLLPVSGGLLLAGLLEWTSGSTRAGRILRRLGLLSTPEEGPGRPAVLRKLETTLAASPPLPPATLEALAADDGLRRWHLAQLPPGGGADGLFDPDAVLARAKLERAGDLAALQEWLTPGETMALLHDPVRIGALRPFDRAA